MKRCTHIPWSGVLDVYCENCVVLLLEEARTEERLKLTSPPAPILTDEERQALTEAMKFEKPKEPNFPTMDPWIWW